ncbi:MAG: hypothetical protein CLLPBCKN_000320 [Chroococcidiopsis cubana SAG 39.79]|uniref:DUF4336 domain-containing protein n=1 Tax=Chroococcidiopsis cubana SAG 39.79 TaxID=388085 RepID=A0AB37UGK9_9CYAN|nr:DUF4336 domain-containing protein [Chroococcidiopsis cubana]MDZ4870932.1 hypothetical protein [Chroococcidiopsis cubana SAG 39.79]PSB64545.1 DUF4336 domain-containing protein [Chroococcidiopsis cubana CCALA 043]RUT10402.1 hypothetical protein DSM107010_42900 [Chroococcidiopsis cubana SAG 39.79]
MQTYEPINTLKSVDENIWIVDGPIAYMQAYGTNIPFPTRMTVIRLANGNLFIHSPTHLTDSLKTEIDALGIVRHLISPNKIHYASIGRWGQVYPQAIKWASPGVRERSKKMGFNITFDRELDSEPDPAWANEIDQAIVRGSRFMEEVVFFHKLSKTIILADLIENFEKQKASKFFAFVARLAGSLDPDGKAPLDLRFTFWGRKKQALAAVDKMLAWEPNKVIFAHGRWYQENGKEELKRAFRWLRN